MRIESFRRRDPNAWSRSISEYPSVEENSWDDGTQLVGLSTVALSSGPLWPWKGVEGWGPTGMSLFVSTWARSTQESFLPSEFEEHWSGTLTPTGDHIGDSNHSSSVIVEVGARLWSDGYTGMSWLLKTGSRGVSVLLRLESKVDAKPGEVFGGSDIVGANPHSFGDHPIRGELISW